MVHVCRITLDEDPPAVALPVLGWQRETCSTRETGPCPVLAVLRPIAVPPSPDAPRATWARFYTEAHGLALVPIPPGEKGPTHPGWNKPRGFTTDPAKAESRWRLRPLENMGALHSASRTATLDLDHAAAPAVLRAVGVDVAALLDQAGAVSTGNPERLAKPWYRVPAELALEPRKLTWPSPEPGGKPVCVFEVRAGAVQDVLPPSLHPCGTPYRWERFRGFEPLPAALLDLWQRWDEALPTMQAACPWAEPEATAPSEADWAAARAEILRRYSLADALAEIGVELRGGKGRCPFHAEDRPSFWTWTTAEGTARWCCAHGGAPVGRATRSGYSTGDAIDLYAWHRGLSVGRATAELAERLGVALPGRPEHGQDCGPAVEVVEPSAPTSAEPIPWPDPLGPEACHGPAGDFVRMVGPHSEADPAALLLGYLLAAGSAIGPFPHYRVGGDDHTARLFAVLVGETSRGRKGSSWGWVRELVAEADPSWRERLAGGLSSGEGMVWAVRDAIHRWETPRKKKGEPAPEPELILVDPGVEDKRLAVVEGEFASTLRVAERDGSTLSAMIRSAWDVGPSGVLQSLVKNAPGKATGAHISILGHVTAPELRRYLTSTEAGNGYGNRILWVAVRRSKLLPDGGSLHPDDLAELVRDLGDRISRARNLGEVRRSPEAAAMWREVYPLLTREEPGLLGAVTARAEAQVLRLSLAYALLDVSPEIRVEHLAAGLEVWRYCEASAAFIFGDAVGDPVADEILRALRGAPDGLTRNELRDLFSRNVASGRMGAALDLLARSGKATMTAERTGGRPAERWRAKPARGYAINAEDAERVPS